MTDLDPFTEALDYPMYVVTAEAGGERGGCLVGFGSQCSMRPVRFIVWLSKVNRTYRVAARADRLAVHLLRRDQDGLARLFGGETGDRTDKFAQVPWHPGPGGVPVLDEAPAWFVGRVEDRVDGGDHVGFLLAPEEVRHPADQGFRLLTLSDGLDIPAGHPVD
ncbi:flavin reductase family protein [Streptomyces sp. A1277]|uniref:flavin reductase family protein n=1 Tax=Streptomyces sp. A1277 TaxID=2563103 RepID=UPI001F109ACD|nr:flavin reductase family protein [Streptomyces sp. A1277]